MKSLCTCALLAALLLLPQGARAASDDDGPSSLEVLGRLADGTEEFPDDPDRAWAYARELACRPPPPRARKQRESQQR